MVQGSSTPMTPMDRPDGSSDGQHEDHHDVRHNGYPDTGGIPNYPMFGFSGFPAFTGFPGFAGTQPNPFVAGLMANGMGSASFNPEPAFEVSRNAGPHLHH